MDILRVVRILGIASLVILGAASSLPVLYLRGPTIPIPNVSYNPAPADRFHAPLSSVGIIAIVNGTQYLTNPAPLAAVMVGSTGTFPQKTGAETIRQNTLRFTTDQSYFPQSETSLAVDPNNPNHIMGGFNDQKFFLCLFYIPSDCAGSYPASVSGFTISNDGGKTVAKSGSLPDIMIGTNFLWSFGDPSVVATVDGNFFYSSLAFSPNGQNGVMLAKSMPNIFDNTVPCVTLLTFPTVNPCWDPVLVAGNLLSVPDSFEDKPLLAVDRDVASPFYGSVYVGWDHFLFNGFSQSYLARCDNNIMGNASCVTVEGGDLPPLSGSDNFASFTTPVVDKNGNVYVTWCNYGTRVTYGPVFCRVRSSPPGGTSFGPATTILSFMGEGTTLPDATVVIGWATEQFRAFSTPAIAVDTSSKSNNVYFTIQVCTTGHYMAIPRAVIPLLPGDNPGNCGASSVLFSKSADGGRTWTAPVSVSEMAVNDQPLVTVDSVTGNVYVLYYTTQYDQFNHRIDVVASKSLDTGSRFRQIRVTSVSNEPDSDPNMYAYYAGGRGGSLTIPQYGDYFQATAIGGKLWVLFTANYAAQQGTFQTDPFLAVTIA